ncbi:MAG: HAMP domain-containing protein [bacterium]|nr:HAMP domain-containing protein [bacterium]
MSRPKPLLSRLFLPYLSVAILTVVFLLVGIGTAFRRAELRQLQHSLTSRLQLVLVQLPGDSSRFSSQDTDSLLRANAGAGSFRLTLMDHEGRVLAETDTLASVVPVQGNRPEMLQALFGKRGFDDRLDPVFGTTQLFVAEPIRHNGQVVGVLRASERIRASRWEFFRQIGGLAAISVLLIAFGVILIYLIVRRVTRPIQELESGAERFARGELDERIEESDTTELAHLSRALNHMAAQLNERIRGSERLRDEQDAVLSSMREGVVAVDRDGRVMIINAAAAEQFQVDAQRAKGRLVEEVVRSTDIHRFIRDTLTAGGPVEREVARFMPDERILQMRGNPIIAVGEVLGVVIVISDVTQMRRIEETRREFVANASHELKTPVTAIIGSIETLREGAMENPRDAERFLDIMSRQADYLQSIIEDLLTLARIEQVSDAQKLAAERQAILPILKDAVDAASSAADSRGQQVVLDCSPEVTASVNAFLIRQAVVNLIDNAAKYSPEGTRIDVRAGVAEGVLVIAVEDRGPGIAEKHLSRIFERFYRIEASRNRKYGGTGLGLAIVKHAALAHGGTVHVDTQLGRGSVFSLRLPK